jgi:hypothetical protein
MESLSLNFSYQTGGSHGDVIPTDQISFSFSGQADMVPMEGLSLNFSYQTGGSSGDGIPVDTLGLNFQPVGSSGHVVLMVQTTPEFGPVSDYEICVLSNDSAPIDAVCDWSTLKGLGCGGHVISIGGTRVPAGDVNGDGQADMLPVETLSLNFQTGGSSGDVLPMESLSLNFSYQTGRSHGDVIPTDQISLNFSGHGDVVSTDQFSLNFSYQTGGASGDVIPTDQISLNFSGHGDVVPTDQFSLNFSYQTGGSHGDVVPVESISLNYSGHTDVVPMDQFSLNFSYQTGGSGGDALPVESISFNFSGQGGSAHGDVLPMESLSLNFSYQTGGSSGDVVPLESVSLNFAPVDENGAHESSRACVEVVPQFWILTTQTPHVFVKSWSTSGDADDRPTEEISFNFTSGDADDRPTEEVSFYYQKTSDALILTESVLGIGGGQPHAGFAGSVRVAVGDVNGDGRAEVFAEWNPSDAHFHDDPHDSFVPTPR